MKVQRELGFYRCFEAFPREYLHITVKELSRFLVARKRFQDEYVKGELP